MLINDYSLITFLFNLSSLLSKSFLSKSLLVPLSSPNLYFLIDTSNCGNGMLTPAFSSCFLPFSML